MLVISTGTTGPLLEGTGKMMPTDDDDEPKPCARPGGRGGSAALGRKPELGDESSPLLLVACVLLLASSTGESAGAGELRPARDRPEPRRVSRLDLRRLDENRTSKTSVGGRERCGDAGALRARSRLVAARDAMALALSKASSHEASSKMRIGSPSWSKNTRSISRLFSSSTDRSLAPDSA